MYTRALQSERSKAVADLDERGLGDSLSGLPFTSLLGDLITEIFNYQTKRQAGTYAVGFSTDINKEKSENLWVRRICRGKCQRYNKSRRAS